MRVLGFGWPELATAWSKDGKEYSPEHLAGIHAAITSELVPGFASDRVRVPLDESDPHAEADRAVTAVGQVRVEVVQRG